MDNMEFIPISRGIIVINKAGNIFRYELKNHEYHVEAINKYLKYSGIDIQERTSYKAGVRASENDLIVMQIDGRNIILYLNNSIYSNMYNNLVNEINERYDSLYSIVYNGKHLDYFNHDEIIDFISSNIDILNKER